MAKNCQKTEGGRKLSHHKTKPEVSVQPLGQHTSRATRWCRLAPCACERARGTENKAPQKTHTEYLGPLLGQKNGHPWAAILSSPVPLQKRWGYIIR